MASDDYATVPSTGKLKLKGVVSGKVEKKKKKKKDKKDKSEDDESKPVDNIQADAEDENLKDRRSLERDEKDLGTEVGKTEAERRHEEMRRKRLDERLKREGVKTHKERVEELNRYLSNLSEHHDMPRIGPG